MCSFFKIITYGFLLILLTSEVINAQASRRPSRGRVVKLSPYLIGLGISMNYFDQEGLNKVINAARTASRANTGTLKVAIEYSGYFGVKLPNNMFMVQVRPSYFTQSSEGTGVGGNFSYDLKGYTAFSLIRMTPYNFNNLDLFAQVGIGFGNIDGKIINGSRFSNFNGSGFGTQIGIGTQFNLYADHAIGLELNYRYLPIVRNLVSRTSSLAPDGIGQAITNRELENTTGNDISTHLTGVLGGLTYTYNF